MASMKKVFIAAMVIGLTFTSILVFAQSGKEALFGLKKLQARCESGISYRDYSNAVADAKFPVNLFMESAEAKKFPELADSMKEVLKHYEYAGYLWNRKMSVRPESAADLEGNMLRGGFIVVNSSLGKELHNLYPETKVISDTYPLDLALPNIWGKATQELGRATELYAKTERDEPSEIDKLKKENKSLKAENTSLKRQLEAMTTKKKK